MQNIRTNIEGDELVIRIDLTAPGTPSKSGKTDVIATTRGNVKIGNVTLGLNCYIKPRTTLPDIRTFG